MKKFFVVPLLALALMTTACRHNVNASNPAVVTVSALVDASNTCKTLENGLTAANQALEKIEMQEPEYYSHVKPLIQKISAANIVAAHKIQAAKNGNPSNWKQSFIAIGTSITPADLTAVQVKNPNSQIIVGSTIAGIVGIIEAIGGAR